jgi:2-polyprenyl-6-methoxyphenol hydroxylase-like FAD-dependent oxidoreductase
MSPDYDVIVVGARCAGASTAMLLARQGHRVLMVDRSRFPSEIPQGHFIHRHGPPRLARWGLLDRVVASGCPPVEVATSYFGDFRLEARDLQVDGVGWGYGPRRAVLDQILVDAARDAGAELREGVAVEDVLWSGERVVGIRRANAAPITARLVVGADGRHSRVAQAVQAETYEAVPTLMCWYFTYFEDVPNTGFEMHVLPQRRIVFTHPTNDNALAVFVGWPIGEFAWVRGDVETSFMEVVDSTVVLGECIRAGRRRERFYGTGDLPNFLRQPYGPGWALVGDAGCHKDPFEARGVCDALHDAELLAECAGSALRGERSLEAGLADYHRRRDVAILPGYRQNVAAARLGPVDPEVLRLRRGLRHRPADVTKFMLARYERVPSEEFFNPHNLQRILAAA